MIDNSALMTRKLEEVREMIRQNAADQARESGRKGYDDEDSPMYGDGHKQSYGGMNEVKKRRGVS